LGFVCWGWGAYCVLFVWEKEMKTFAKVAVCLLVCLVLPTQVFSQANTWPDYRGNMIGVPMSASGSIPSGVLYCEPPISDTLPMVCYFQGADAWAEATGANRVGGNQSICPGVGTRQYTIDDFSMCAGDNVHIIVDGTDVTLTEGAQWNRGASNNAACVSLAVAVEASAVGTLVNAYCPGGGTVVYIQPAINTCWIDLTESDSTCTSLVEGSDGQILNQIGTAARPAYSFMGRNGSGMFSLTPSVPVGFSVLGIQEMTITAGTTQITTNDLDIIAGIIYDSNSVLQLGTAAATGHALATGDVLVGGKLEVDGAVYLDNFLYLSNATYISSGQIIGSDNIAADGVSLYPRAVTQTPDTGMILLGPAGNSILVVEYADRTTDFAFPLQANPTLAIQSADAGTITDTIYIQHDQTNGIIATRGGMLVMNPATAGLVLPRIINAAPAEPIACGAASEGASVYVDDTNDTLWGQVCICSNKDGTGYDWRDMSNIASTACPFF